MLCSDVTVALFSVVYNFMLCSKLTVTSMKYCPCGLCSVTVGLLMHPHWLRGHSSSVTLFFWKIDTHPSLVNANNIEQFTFVTLFSRKFETTLHYVTLEWPLMYCVIASPLITSRLS